MNKFEVKPNSRLNSALRNNCKQIISSLVAGTILLVSIPSNIILAQSANQPLIKKEKANKSKTIKPQDNKAFIEMPLSVEAIERLQAESLEGQVISNSNHLVEPSPKAIRPGITPDNVSFFANALSPEITAIADVNGDKVIDTLARETFTSLTNKDEVAISFTSSNKSGHFYLGSLNKSSQMGTITILDNDKDITYQGVSKKSFSIGKGSPMSMITIDSPKGDILIVGTVFTAGEAIVNPTPDDFFSITAFLPDNEGFPDPNQKVDILAPKQDLFGTGAVFNFSFGGMALDDKNNLYVNVGISTKTTIGGNILVFTDTNNDLIPDKANLLIGQGNLVPVVITASSIKVEPLPEGGNQILFFSTIDLIFNGSSPSIARYLDKDKNLLVDGPPTAFITFPRGFSSVLRSLGPGSSGFITSRMSINDGKGLCSYRMASGTSTTDSGVAFFNKAVDGLEIVPQFLQAPRIDGVFDVFTFVSNTPIREVKDITRPTVKVLSPNGGESLTSGNQLTISFNSSDDTAITSQDINLSLDGGATFPISIASGLPANVQSFNFSLPTNLESKMARVQVIARDEAGNMGVDISDLDFVIAKSEVKDTVAPTITINNPTTDATLQGGERLTINFNSQDNIGVTSHNVLLATDGNNFTPLANALAGNVTSFTFQLPTTNTDKAAIRVEALDQAGNKGVAAVNFKIFVDQETPKVTISSPTAKQKVKGGQSFTVTFNSTDNLAVVSQDIEISLDGTNFTPLVSGLSGDANSATVTIPNMKAKAAIIRVIAKDKAGNVGMAISPTFKIKATK